jgi:uncharacterized membrane protein
MISSVEQYLAKLKEELSGSDRATIQDALSDAEEYLRMALEDAAIQDTIALAAVIKEYGSPEEIAAEYKRAERHHTVSMTGLQKTIEIPVPVADSNIKDNRQFYIRFWTVFAEPAAWGALLYSILALITGILYFTWVVTGISVSAGLLVLIIGLPIAGFFLLSVRGIALVEGRMVEALLGVRMPRRARYAERNVGIWQRFKNMLGDERTWFSIIYMILQLPLGVLYFSLLISLISVALWTIAWPVISICIGQPLFMTANHAYYATGWLIPIVIIAGLVILTATLHLAKAIGRGHGALAKALLVRP